MSPQKLTQAELKEYLSYDPLTGLFTYIKAKSGIHVGQVAGSINGHGYIIIKIRGQSYHAGRLAFLYMTGAFPKNLVDHIHKIRTDNRWAELQDITNQENCRKKGMNKNNKSGVTGVRWNKKLNKWQVTLRVDGRNKHFGVFVELCDATLAIQKAKRENGYNANHGVRA